MMTGPLSCIPSARTCRRYGVTPYDYTEEARRPGRPWSGWLMTAALMAIVAAGLGSCGGQGGSVTSGEAGQTATGSPAPEVSGMTEAASPSGGQPVATDSRPANGTGLPATGPSGQAAGTDAGATAGLPSATVQAPDASTAAAGTDVASSPQGGGTAGGDGHDQTAAQTTQPTQAARPAGARRLGELVFAEGSVSLHRAGASAVKADIGDVVNAFDVLVTGPRSRAEIDIGSGAAGGATIKLAENTAFYFDTKELDDAARRTVVQLLSGSVAIKVDKLANGSFQVGTDNAVLGVRGTVFIVDTVPDASLLVTCDQGAVSVTADGATTTAKPGGVVELPAAGSMRLRAVEPADLGTFRSGWKTDAFREFSSKALAFASSYASTLDGNRQAFRTALAKLDAQKATLDAWRTAKASGREPRFTDWIPEKKAVASSLFDALKALFLVERPYYRLLELRALHAGGTGVGTLKDGRQSAAFYAGFDAAYADLAAGMGRVREALLLFSWASAGSPLGEFFGSKADSLGSGSMFFGE